MPTFLVKKSNYLNSTPLSNSIFSLKVVSGDVREVMCEYHIIYSASYSVPVLYFTAMTKGIQCTFFNTLKVFL